MNNQVSKESKDAAIKTLAIIGFIAAIVVILWGAVQVVRFIPTTFATLASIADSVYDREIEFTIVTEKNIINSGDAFTVSWTTLTQSGTYIFTYQCVDGVSAEVRNSNGDIAAVTCDQRLPLAASGETNVIFTSEDRRFTDVPFSISFTEAGESETTVEKSGLVTIVNATIAQSDDVAGDDEQDSNTDENGDASDNTDDTTGGTTGSTQTVTGSFPVSDPNGTTDLKLTYRGIGSFNPNTNVFTPAGTLDNDGYGAIRFAVENIGTKTSGVWNYEAVLPTSPTYTYDGAPQDPLRPSESVIITVAFDDIRSAGSADIEVEILGGNDIFDGNNNFEWNVVITD